MRDGGANHGWLRRERTMTMVAGYRATWAARAASPPPARPPAAQVPSAAPPPLPGPRRRDDVPLRVVAGERFAQMRDGLIAPSRDLEHLGEIHVDLRLRFQLLGLLGELECLEDQHLGPRFTALGGDLRPNASPEEL